MGRSGSERCQKAATSTPSRTRCRPTRWSASWWVCTTRSSRRMPRRRSHPATWSSSRPPSTSIRTPSCSTRTASPCPTSIAVITSDVGARGSTNGTQPANATAVTATPTVSGRLRGRHHATAASGASSNVTGLARLTAGTTCPTSAAHSTIRRGRLATTRNGPAAVGVHVATRPPSPTSAVATAAAGTATRLAGTDPNGTSSNARSRSGTTASCAATVTAANAATPGGTHGRRNRTCAVSGSDHARIPAVAPTDSNRPNDVARSGSASTSTATATPRTCHGRATTPRNSATPTSRAIATARRTDGSARVRTRNHASDSATTSARTRRHSRRRAATTTTAPTTTATFDPDTATRWVRPEAVMSRRVSSGRSDVSPVTSPTARPARGGDNQAAAAVRSDVRTCVVVRQTGPGSAIPAASRSRAWATT